MPVLKHQLPNFQFGIKCAQRIQFRAKTFQEATTQLKEHASQQTGVPIMKSKQEKKYGWWYSHCLDTLLTVPIVVVTPQRWNRSALTQNLVQMLKLISLTYQEEIERFITHIEKLAG